MITFAFFGTPEFSTIILDELKSKNFLPSLIVTSPDKPKGRKLILTPSPVKVWAEHNNIPHIENLEIKNNFDLFIVASYGKILSEKILNIPKHGILNVHPSLLPKLRGASPIKSAILSENETGVTIIKLDKEMDHGPIIAQKKIISWTEPPYEEDLENLLAHEGGKLLAEIIPDWISGKIKAEEQDHDKATFSKKIKKEDGEIHLNDNPELNLRKIRAFHRWPTAYFFQNGKRIIIKKAHIENGELILDRVIPEGKKETDGKDFLKGGQT